MQTRRQTQLKQREMESAETLISMMQQSNPKSLPIKKRRLIAPASAARAGAGSSQALVLAFASSGSSLRQREASLAGLLPPEIHTLILEHLPVTPEYE
jgi:hypothetical protein